MGTRSGHLWDRSIPALAKFWVKAHLILLGQGGLSVWAWNPTLGVQGRSGEAPWDAAWVEGPPDERAFTEARKEEEG